MAYLEIRDGYPMNNMCDIRLAGLSSGWEYGQRTCRWYLKKGEYPEAEKDNPIKETYINNNSASSTDWVSFVGLDYGAKYYCRCYVYCFTDEWKANSSTPKEPISRTEITFTIKFKSNTTELGTISSKTININTKESYIMLIYKMSFAQNGTATFSTKNSSFDTLGYLSTTSEWNDNTGDKPKNPKATGDNSNSNNFTIEYSVSAGTTYYLWLRSSDGESYGSTTLNISFSGSGGGGGGSSASDFSIDRIDAYYIPSMYALSVKWYGTNMSSCSYKIQVNGTQVATGTLGNTDNYTKIVDADGSTIYKITVSISKNSETASKTVSIVGAPWSWSDIQSGVAVNTISYTRWNDFCELILVWLQTKGMQNNIPIKTGYGSSVSLQGLISEAKMNGNSEAGRTLTANRFNIVQMCICQLNGETTFTPVESRDPVYASYFTNLATKLNDTPR